MGLNKEEEGVNSGKEAAGILWRKDGDAMAGSGDNRGWAGPE